MVCRHCGNEIQEGVRFCPSCGALNSPAPDSGPSQGAAPAWEGPEGGGGRKKTGLFLGLGAAAVAVVALVAVFAGGLFASPKGQVEQAFAKTAAAYLAAEEKLGLPDMAQWQKDQTLAQHMSLVLTGVNSQLVGYDLSALNGLGLYMDADYDGPNRALYAGLRAAWGEDDLLSFEMLAEDSTLSFGLPQFLGADYIGVNTETLGADLARLSGDDSVSGISFNLFDLIDKAMEQVDPEAMERALQEANEGLLDAMEVKKLGARTLDLNGVSTKTTAYQAVIPQTALDQYVDDMTAVLSAMNYYSLYEELYRSMGLPQDQIDEIMSALEGLDVYGGLAELLHDAVDEIGSLELEICVSGGYISAIFYQGRAGGFDVAVSVCLGGGEEYVDDLSILLEIDDTEVEIKSTGDHGLKRGVYTDETTIRLRQDGSSLGRVTSELSIDPEKQSGNFAWKLGVDSSGFSVFVLETEGSLNLDTDRLSLDLEEVSVRAAGMEVCTLRFGYDISCQPAGHAPVNAKMLEDMTELDLMDLGLDVQSNAIVWLSAMEQLFTSRLPEELLWAVTGIL